MLGPVPWDPFPHGELDPTGPDPLHDTLYRGAVTAADAYRGVREAFRVEGELLRIGNRFVPASRYREIAFLSFGNAANSMAHGVIDALGQRVTQGFIAGPDPVPDEIPFQGKVVPAGWPGGASSAQAASAALELAEGLRIDDLLLILVSPGTLTALALPPTGYSSSDWTEFLQEVYAHGATGAEVGLIARLLGSGGVGGQLAARAPNGEVNTFLVDRGDGPTILGGGPSFLPTNEERSKGRAVLERLGLLADLPADRRAAVSPDPTLPTGFTARVERPVIVASPGDALRGAADAAFDKRWRSRLAMLQLEAPPEDAAGIFVDRVNEIVGSETYDIEAKTKGIATFAMTTLNLPEGVDSGPGLARFLHQAAARLSRREMSISLSRTSGAVGDAAYPPGAVVGAAGRAAPSVLEDRPRGLRMGRGITDVGFLAVGLFPRLDAA